MSHSSYPPSPSLSSDLSTLSDLSDDFVCLSDDSEHSSTSSSLRHSRSSEFEPVDVSDSHHGVSVASVASMSTDRDDTPQASIHVSSSSDCDNAVKQHRPVFLSAGVEFEFPDPLSYSVCPPASNVDTLRSLSSQRSDTLCYLTSPDEPQTDAEHDNDINRTQLHDSSDSSSNQSSSFFVLAHSWCRSYLVLSSFTFVLGFTVAYTLYGCNQQFSPVNSVSLSTSPLAPSTSSFFSHTSEPSLFRDLVISSTSQVKALSQKNFARTDMMVIYDSGSRSIFGSSKLPTQSRRSRTKSSQASVSSSSSSSSSMQVSRDHYSLSRRVISLPSLNRVAQGVSAILKPAHHVVYPAFALVASEAYNDVLKLWNLLWSCVQTMQSLAHHSSITARQSIASAHAKIEMLERKLSSMGNITLVRQTLDMGTSVGQSILKTRHRTRSTSKMVRQKLLDAIKRNVSMFSRGQKPIQAESGHSSRKLRNFWRL